MRIIFCTTTMAGVPAGAMFAKVGGTVSNNCTVHFLSWPGIYKNTNYTVSGILM